MNNIQRAIIPGTCIGIFLLFLMVNFLQNPHNPSESQQQVSIIVSPKYPDSILQWSTIIDHYAVQYQLDANLVAAMILQESGGDAQAYSKSGAVGLMQVMPRDGLASNFMCQNGPCFSKRPSTNELYDPDFNVRFGCEMLSGMIYRYGNIRDALKAYGPVGIGYDYADIILSIYQHYQ